MKTITNTSARSDLLDTLRGHFRGYLPEGVSKHVADGNLDYAAAHLRGAAEAVLDRQKWDLGESVDAGPIEDLRVGMLREIDRMVSEIPHIDEAFVRELLDGSADVGDEPAAEPAPADEYAVVAEAFIMAIGRTASEAVNDYAATGLEVREDGEGGWEALSASDTEWQPVQIIRISPELADHIRQHGAPDSWDTINGVAHLEREDA